MSEPHDNFWVGVAVGILISSLFGMVVYFVALVKCCVL